MHSPPFPVYLRLSGGHSLYRIESETAFTEVQQLGTRYIVHSIKAITWPERLRIADMLANKDGLFVAATGAEFEDQLRLAQRK